MQKTVVQLGLGCTQGPLRNESPPLMIAGGAVRGQLHI